MRRKTIGIRHSESGTLGKRTRRQAFEVHDCRFERLHHPARDVLHLADTVFGNTHTKAEIERHFTEHLRRPIHDLEARLPLEGGPISIMKLCRSVKRQHHPAEIVADELAPAVAEHTIRGRVDVQLQPVTSRLHPSPVDNDLHEVGGGEGLSTEEMNVKIPPSR